MVQKNIQMKNKNGATWDDLFPKTKSDIVLMTDGVTTLTTALTNKVDVVAGKQLSTEDYTTAEKTKLAGVATNANNYVHPTGDGNSHVPATGTTNNLKVLKAGATANSSAWGSVDYSELTNRPTLGTASSANTGTGSGNVPVLDASGKLATSTLPSIAITDTFVVANQTAMLALTAQTGDVAIRTDLSKTFILSGTNATLLADWKELSTPTDAVTSVNGLTGAVSLTASSVGASAISVGTADPGTTNYDVWYQVI